MDNDNGPFEDVCPTKTGGFSIAMLVYRRVKISSFMSSCLLGDVVLEFTTWFSS